MKAPQISVIMPVYNGEKYLSEAINSIINQTYTDFELLIIDDFSTDNSIKIVQEYQKRDDRVKLLRNRYKKGVAGALNTGMENAKGIYFARADADDLNRKDRLEKQFNYLENHKDVCLLAGGYAPFNKNGHRIDIIRSASSMEIAWRFISDTYFCHPTVMFKREIHDEFGGYPNEEAEDFSYFSKIVKKYRCSNIKEILIDYRELPANRSFSSAEKIGKSVKKIFSENYFFYTRDHDYSEVFYGFQANGKLNIKYFLKIFRLNLIILNKIRKQYKIPFSHIEYIDINLKIFWKYLCALAKKAEKPAKKIIKWILK